MMLVSTILVFREHNSFDELEQDFLITVIEAVYFLIWHWHVKGIIFRLGKT